MKRYSIVHNMDDDGCLICGDGRNTHIHEVFYGTAKRQLSINYGLCVRLCPRHHNGGREGVHQNRELDTKLKKHAQKIAMERYGWTVDDFIKIFGKSYL